MSGGSTLIIVIVEGFFLYRSTGFFCFFFFVFSFTRYMYTVQTVSVPSSTACSFIVKKCKTLKWWQMTSWLLAVGPLTSWSYCCPQLQQHGLLRVKMSKHPLQISTSERKILIVLCYYILLSVVALTGVTFPLRNAELLANALTEYWQCETAGVAPLCNRLRASFEELTNPGIITVSYVLLWIFPAVNLIFAVNISELK